MVLFCSDPNKPEAVLSADVETLSPEITWPLPYSVRENGMEVLPMGFQGVNWLKSISLTS